MIAYVGYDLILHEILHEKLVTLTGLIHYSAIIKIIAGALVPLIDRTNHEIPQVDEFHSL
jgi:hypothetical protein